MDDRGRAGPVGTPAIPRRVAVFSLHTSPLVQPGTGDAGGMNVYIAQTSRRLAGRGVEVEIFTRAISSDQPPVVRPWSGVTVRHVVAGPFDGMEKNDLPGQLCAFTAGVLRAEAHHEVGFYDLVHSHYWLSGQVGYLAKDRWGVPLVHSAHTLARVKNSSLAAGDTPEPRGRLIGEAQVVAEADLLVANTALDAADLIEHYGADPARIRVVAPGVDTEVFRPGSRSAARQQLGLADDELILTFAGRLQPLKAPDVLVRATGVLARRYPERRFRVVIVGGSSGPGPERGRDLLDLADSTGLAGRLTVLAPVPPAELAVIFQASDVVAVPSHNESFGLVALEAQAAGVPVVATRVGGLTVAVADESTGLLVPGHDPQDWAERLGRILFDPARRAAMAAAAPVHAARFSWESTVDGLLEAYRSAVGRPLVHLAG